MPASPNDEAFARYLVQIGNASVDQIDAAKIKQEEHAKKRILVSLGEVLEQQGVLTKSMRENVEKKLLAQNQGGIKQLGNFKLLNKLGEGGMGAVYLAEDIVAKRRVALKVLARNRATDTNFLTRFKREAKAAGKLKHPNIVSAYTARDTDVREEIGFHFYAMEYCEGESLEHVLERDKMIPWERALDITAQVASGLQYAHANGIIHRDIKPANIYIVSGGVAKILDMGLSKNLIDSGQSFNTLDGQVLGTPHYISPEQAQGSREIDGRADIYSLGATLFHLLTGNTPYNGPAPANIIMQHITEPVPDLFAMRPDLPEDLCHIVRVMMAKNPNERYLDCSLLLGEIDLFKLGEPLPSKAIVCAAEMRAAEAKTKVDDEKFMRDFYQYAKIGGVFAAVLIVLLIINSVVHWFMGPSQWEVENKDRIMALSSDGDASLRSNDWRQAYEKFQKIVALAKEEAPKDAKLQSEIGRAKQEIERLSKKLAEADEAKRLQEVEAQKLVEANKLKALELEQQKADEKKRKAEVQRQLVEAQQAEAARKVEEEQKAEAARVADQKAKEDKKKKEVAMLEEQKKKEEERLALEKETELYKKRIPLRQECIKPMETAISLLSNTESKLGPAGNYSQFVESVQNNWPQIERSLNMTELTTLIEKLNDTDAAKLKKSLAAVGEMVFKCQAEWKSGRDIGKLEDFDRQAWMGRMEAELDDAKTVLQRLK